MEFINIDSVLVGFYLILTLAMGIIYGKGTKSMEVFALGGRNFSTGALTATITATYVSGSSFIIGITYGYQDGILDFLATSGQIFVILLLAFVFIPRMGEFLGDFSIAESMEKMFGRRVGIITACSGIVISIGFVAMQLKILSDAFSYFSNAPMHLSVPMCAPIMITYCVYGGIRGVIFTDILQFVTFMVVVPGIAIGIWYKLNIGSNPVAYDAFLTKIFSLESTSGADYLTWFFYFLIPGFSPPFFQRVTASANVKQASDAFLHSAYLYFVYILISAITGILLFVYDNSLSESQIFPFMLDKFTFPGLKGLTFIAIIAMAMSTADSHLNTFAVMFTRDICKKFGFAKDQDKELKLAQISTIVIGILAAILAMYFNDLIKLLLFSRNFYEPLVAPPLILAILGFRSSSSAVLTGMKFGFGTVIIWKTFQYFIPGVLTIDSLMPATFMNLTAYVLTHYLCGEPGGWVGPKHTAPLEIARKKSRAFREKIFTGIADFFSSLFISSEHQAKLKEVPAMHSLFGILIIASYFTVTISNPSLSQKCSDVYILQLLSCGIGALLITYPLWNMLISARFRNAITLYSLLYLIYSNIILMLAHGFSSISVMSFLINILVIGFFGRIVTTIMIVIFGFLFGISKYIGSGYVVNIHSGADFMFIASYGSFALAIILMSFLNRYQNEIETLTESESSLLHLNSILESQVQLREERISKALNIQRDMLNNVSHEIRTPIQVASVATDMLVESWNNKANMSSAPIGELIFAVKNGVDRIKRYAGNMLDLSEYHQGRMLFDIKPQNIRNFMEKILEPYDNILLKIDPKVPEMLDFDEIKMSQIFKELILNANDYTSMKAVAAAATKTDAPLRDGPYPPLKVNEYTYVPSKAKQSEDPSPEDLPMTIEITIERCGSQNFRIFVKDHGIGIPEDELSEVFDPLYISTRTRSTAGGKGMGLALVKGAVAGHGGNVRAYNNVWVNGVTIEIILPIKQEKPSFLGSNAPVEDAPPAIDIAKIIADIKAIEKNFGGRKPKILLIEDERALQASVAMLVASMGYDFRGETHGQEALKYIMSDEFDADIVLLDMMLPDTNGLEIMKKAHEKLAKRKVPVIIQSGLPESEPMIQEVLKLGAKSFMSKPYSLKILKDELKQSLGLA
jgi:Na+/proline symporter/signal transduction histidine kinase/CheY-like chemotaxis protein